ncbi:DNA-directed RNA polymerase family I and III subunit [Gregarina niphandrodes]|uniref:DNA-directed RNA polymerase family I and III subunit n=1 Tax=Gregarina niphandrodes TaxID=110365 RepID=A0A023B0I0_GRENI|nr:DNA-directed RNA polymerase family I and III subunit [Gregarina niphandrodes]EZG45041.1 DNA-directed RNA polymerase family I and III subunit [Gregarina niphandrodes]|eukprot:XP_011132590.1 DNA-directed RNA polymerase family I and III subunit [Gregarina niphandrodes]
MGEYLIFRPEKMEGLPSHLQAQVKELVCGLEGPRDVESITSASTFAAMGVCPDYDMKKLVKRMSIDMRQKGEERVLFDLKGVDVAMANALRRVMIAEVPTMAIETVHLYQNTGVLQDEVLCHRLGLVPFKVEPETYKYRTENEELTAENSLCFKLHIVCTPENLDQEKKCLPVYSRDFVWVPLSEQQKEQYPEPPRPVSEDYLITKLRPGQEIEAVCYLEKGIGKTHAKWSPVCPAVYRLHPKIIFPQGVLRGPEAEDLVNLCPMNVFDIENGEAIVAKPTQCTTCRACIERFPTQVEVRKIKDHFIFQVEATGSIPAPDVFKRSLSVLIQKLQKIKNNIEKDIQA